MATQANRATQVVLYEGARLISGDAKSQVMVWDVAGRKAVTGWQPSSLGGRPVYVLPSTSGLNAATPLSALVEHLRAVAAGP